MKKFIFQFQSDFASWERKKKRDEKYVREIENRKDIKKKDVIYLKKKKEIK